MGHPNRVTASCNQSDMELRFGTSPSPDWPIVWIDSSGSQWSQWRHNCVSANQEGESQTAKAHVDIAG